MTAERWLLLAYACSGFAGLSYEIIWARLLTLHLGHTTAAVSTVTAAFMGGLGLGAALGGRVAAAQSRRRALGMYVVLELIVAISAFAIVCGLPLMSPLFAWAYGEDGSGAFFSMARIASALAVLLVPAIALGATFPMAVRVAVARSAHPGGAAGRLYAVNTTGAAFGSLAAGFVLIPALGLMGTTLAGMAASAASMMLALVVARSGLSDDVAEDVRERPRDIRPTARKGRKARQAIRVAANDDGEAHRSGYGLAAAVLALTGFATFVYEIVWTRVLAMVLGPSIYAFAATLTSFIVGLAVGSFVGASLAERSRRPIVLLMMVLTLTAAAAGVSVGVVGSSVIDLGSTAQRAGAPVGSIAGVVLPNLAIAFSLTLPIAIGLGLAFPLAFELAGSRDATPARRLGALYGLNTAASVVGASVAGFVAIPSIGLRLSLYVATASLLLGAFALVIRGVAPGRGRLVAVLPVAAVVVLMVTSPQWDREWLAAGGYLYTRYVPSGVDRRAALTAGSLVYYREGATGTVSVKELTGNRSLSIDGKVDASTGGDMLTQKLLAHLPLLLHPNPRQVSIVGLGSGVTLASALVHPVSAVDVIEISPEVVEASTHFADVNRRALDDPRARLVRGDGRTHLSLTSRRYDVVISEPSNPWIAGIAALFTRDFFRNVRDRLAPGGIFCQWAHTYDVSDADLRSIVATFHAVFPEGTMWLSGDGDLLLVGSTSSLEPRFEGLIVGWNRPGVAEDLRGVGARAPFALVSLYAGGPREMSLYAARGIVQTDDRNPLEFSGAVAAFDRNTVNHAEAIRKLLQPDRLPTSISVAFARATASEWRDRGAMLTGAEAFDAAYGDYVRAFELMPNDSGTLDGLIRAAAAAHRQDNAETRLRAALQSGGAGPAVTVALARLLGVRGRFDEAISVAIEATKLVPTDGAAWEQLASLYADLGDADRLGPVAEVLRQKFSQRAGSWYFKASESFLRGDAAAALPLVRRAIELDVDYADAYNLLGAIHGTMGDTVAARDAFGTSLRLDSRDVVTYVNLAQLELAAGQLQTAADLFAQALTLDPNSAAAREGLAQARR